MERNWLIRTKSNHILGPVSKDKVLELYRNGSIKPDDEICSGNGYWFFIREDDMVERFLLGEEIQSFNPISEAKNVLKNSAADDLTLIGGVDLSGLKETDDAIDLSADPPNSLEEDTAGKTPLIQDSPLVESKKKNKPALKSGTISAGKKRLAKKQNYLQYIGVLCFILLFLMIYYRQAIIQIIFRGEITSATFSFISAAQAQDTIASPHFDILNTQVKLDGVIFRPHIGLDGFKVISSLDIEDIPCSELQNEVNQLAILLYPPEEINEKFLIKMRNCVMKLKEDHPLNKWMRWVGRRPVLSKKNEKDRSFLLEIINSKFNLITDLKIKNKIIHILNDINEETLPELILKSYLYLVIGNITRADNLLRGFIEEEPRFNWRRSDGSKRSYFHQLGKEQVSQILAKLSRHPVDRRIFELFGLYIQNFYNDEELLDLTSDIDTSTVESKLSLKFTEGISPSFIKYLRIKRMSENRRLSKLRNADDFSFDMQAYWIWPFFEISPIISDVMLPELKRIESSDELWFIYLLNDEKIADLFAKKSGKSFLPGRRTFLKENLQKEVDFMMSLYKLIELGDINSDLVSKTSEYLIK